MSGANQERDIEHSDTSNASTHSEISSVARSVSDNMSAANDGAHWVVNERSECTSTI
jgi:hypothetical protein